MTLRFTAVATAVALLAISVAGWAQPARANGVPQLVKLTYLEGVSNFGPKDAEGVLEFSFAEAYARIELKNLKPTPGYSYEGWLVGGQGKPFPVGKLPVAPSGVGAVETKLEGLDRFDYDLFVVVARPDGSAAAAMPDQKSVAGRFTVLKDVTPGASADVRPDLLPDTGQEPGGAGTNWKTPLAVVAGAAVVAFGGLRVLRGRKHHA